MTHTQLTAALAAELEISKLAAAEILRAIFGGGVAGAGVLAAALEADPDHRVVVAGFGTFLLRDRPARAGRNPATGAPIHIPAGRRVAFRPARALRAALRA